MRKKILAGTLCTLLLSLAVGHEIAQARPTPTKTSKSVQPAPTKDEDYKGLSLRHFPTKVPSSHGDSTITVLKIDPKLYELELLSATEHDSLARTAPRWAEDFDLQAVINAGMFEPDGRNTGYMKNHGHVNNPEFKRTYNSIFAFGRTSSKVPEAKLIDLRCEKFGNFSGLYSSFSQSIRMIDCKGKNTWQQQRKKWSMAALGTDKKGNVLFIHSRSPYTVHDFIDHLLKIPIGIERAMYLEGGPEASLYVKTPQQEFNGIGSYETGFNENDRNAEYWTLPNVFGVRKK
jgi:uncharacterized protein YigE (DUF2233 family)